MHSYLGLSNIMTRTGWSMGAYADLFGYPRKGGGDYNKTGFRVMPAGGDYGGNMTINPGSDTYEVRCVRDVR